MDDDVDHLAYRRRQFRPASAEGERCYCGALAEHKVEEVIFPDDPLPHRHPYTRYICRSHFVQIMGVSAARLYGLTDSTG